MHMHQHLVFTWAIHKHMVLLIIVITIIDDHHIDHHIAVDHQDTQDLIDQDQDHMNEVLFILPAKLYTVV